MYLSVKEIAKKWNMSERSIRNYCAKGRIEGAFLTGKTWNIPADATKPIRKNCVTCKEKTLKDILAHEMQSKISGGIYHKIQIDFAYNSNRIEGSRLSYDETRYIFETNTIGINSKTYNVDDIVETVNHFRCVDIMIKNVSKQLTESYIKYLHLILKSGTRDSRKSWFNASEYKKLPNEVGGKETAKPENVAIEMSKLLANYKNIKNKTFEDILEFHHTFENIHPFQDGNGRIGRLIMFKECLNNSIVPFIINEQQKLFYYRGLREWEKEKGYLIDTCLSAQDQFKKYLDYFKINY